MAGLCNWAAAMCTYHTVEKDVAPKIVKLRAAEAELRIAEREKNAALSELATVQASLDNMQVIYPAITKFEMFIQVQSGGSSSIFIRS